MVMYYKYLCILIPVGVGSFVAGTCRIPYVPMHRIVMAVWGSSGVTQLSGSG